MNILDTIANRISNIMVGAARTRARLDLLKRNDRFLADNGFSRTLLEQGNGAWPWRVDATDPLQNERHFVMPTTGAHRPPSAIVAAPDAPFAVVDVPSPRTTHFVDPEPETARAA